MVTTILVVLLSICVILLSREILKLKERLNTLHNETNNRISVTDQQTHLRINEELEKLHLLVRTMESDIKSDTKEKLQKLTEQIIKKLPPTNDELMERIEKIEEESYRLRMNM
jgi:predicted Holliday junction resolvase-like endonuclease